MYDYTSNNWSHWNSNEKFKQKFGSYTRIAIDIAGPFTDSNMEKR